MTTNKYANAIIAVLKKQEAKVAIAESVTGGNILATLIRIPTASEVVYGGIVAYQTHAKQNWFKLSRKTEIYSITCVETMVRSLAQKTACEYIIATSGCASAASFLHNSVGTFWFALYDVRTQQLMSTESRVRRWTRAGRIQAMTREVLVAFYDFLLAKEKPLS